MLMILSDDEILLATISYMQRCWYWRRLHACKNIDVDDDELLYERMHCWFICSCIHKSDSFIHIGDDQIFISILATTEYFVFRLATIMIQMYLEVTTLKTTWYHMHIESCLWT